jgi:hypothetical protein
MLLERIIVSVVTLDHGGLHIGGAVSYPGVLGKHGRLQIRVNNLPIPSPPPAAAATLLLALLLLLRRARRPRRSGTS